MHEVIEFQCRVSLSVAGNTVTRLSSRKKLVLGLLKPVPAQEKRTGIRRDIINEEQHDAAAIHTNALTRTDSDPSRFQYPPSAKLKVTYMTSSARAQAASPPPASITRRLRSHEGSCKFQHQRSLDNLVRCMCLAQLHPPRRGQRIVPH